jgi:acetyl esterase
MIDPDIAQLLEQVNAEPEPGGSSPTVADHRTRMDRMATFLAPKPRIELDSVVDSTIPGAGRDISVRTYQATNQPTATVMFFHGGGWITGDLDSHDFLVRKLANETGFGFVAVDYRLAPENPFPAGLDDCTAAAMWVGEHAEDFGGIKGQLAVSGDGTGGNLAAVVARKFRDANRQMTAQLLLYPVTDSDGHYPSRDEYGEGYLVSANDTAISIQEYLGNSPSLVTTEDVAPLRAINLNGLAPAVIGIAHTDPYRDEGLAYAQALETAGVDVFVSEYEGMIHNFAAMFAISDGANQALTDILGQLSKKMSA